MSTMKISLIVVPLLVALSSSVSAWDTRENPDRLPSVAFNAHRNKASVGDMTAQSTELGINMRIPISNSISVSADGQKIANSSAAYGFGGEIRFYMQNDEPRPVAPNPAPKRAVSDPAML